MFPLLLLSPQPSFVEDILHVLSLYQLNLLFVNLHSLPLAYINCLSSIAGSDRFFSMLGKLLIMGRWSMRSVERWSEDAVVAWGLLGVGLLSLVMALLLLVSVGYYPEEEFAQSTLLMISFLVKTSLLMFIFQSTIHVSLLVLQMALVRPRRRGVKDGVSSVKQRISFQVAYTVLLSLSLIILSPFERGLLARSLGYWVGVVVEIISPHPVNSLSLVDFLPLLGLFLALSLVGRWFFSRSQIRRGMVAEGLPTRAKNIRVSSDRLACASCGRVLSKGQKLCQCGHKNLTCGACRGPLKLKKQTISACHACRAQFHSDCLVTVISLQKKCPVCGEVLDKRSMLSRMKPSFTDAFSSRR